MDYVRDPRFASLGLLLGTGRFDAIGRMAFVYEFCTDQERSVLTPFELDGITESLGFGAKLIQCNLAEAAGPDFRIKGTEGRIEWLAEQRRNGKIGGKKSAQTRREKSGSAQPKRRPSEGSVEGVAEGPVEGFSNPKVLKNYSTKELINTCDAFASGAATAASPEGVGSDLVLKKPLPPTNPRPKGDSKLGMGGGGQAFLKAYVDAYTARYGCRPAITGKDAGISKRLVAALGDSRACLAAQVYLQLNDPWFETKHHDLATLEQNLNKVTHALATGKGSEHVADEKFWNEVWRDSGKVQRSDSETKTNLRGQGLPARQSETDF